MHLWQPAMRDKPPDNDAETRAFTERNEVPAAARWIVGVLLGATAIFGIIHLASNS